jgi:hypothetical protein
MLIVVTFMSLLRSCGTGNSCQDAEKPNLDVVHDMGGNDAVEDEFSGRLSDTFVPETCAGHIA